MIQRKIYLKSSDGPGYWIDYHIAIESSTLKLFLGPDSYAGTSEIIKLPVHSSKLKRTIDFMESKYGIIGNNPVEFGITDDETLDLLEIASYLEI